MTESAISQLIWGSTASLFTAPQKGQTSAQAATSSFVDGFSLPGSGDFGTKRNNAGLSAGWGQPANQLESSSDISEWGAQSVPAEAQKPMAETQRMLDEPTRLEERSKIEEAAKDANPSVASASPSSSIEPSADEQTPQRAQEDDGEASGLESAASSQSAEPMTAAHMDDGAERTPESATTRDDDAAEAAIQEGALLGAEPPASARPRPSGGREDQQVRSSRAGERGMRRGEGKSERHDSKPGERVGADSDRGEKIKDGGKGRGGVKAAGRIANQHSGSEKIANNSGTASAKGATGAGATPSSISTTSETGAGNQATTTVGKGLELSSASSNSNVSSAKTEGNQNAAPTVKLPAHVRGVMAMTNTRGGNMTMRLHPESLGPLRVQMSINQGQVSVQFHTQTADASALIRDSVDGLRSALESQGYRLDQVTIQPLSRGESQGQAAGGQDHSDRHGSGSESEHDAGGERSRGFSDRDADTPPERGQADRGRRRSFASRLDDQVSS